MFVRMSRSLPESLALAKALALALAIVVGAAGCASKKPPSRPPSGPPYAHTATLDVTNGIGVLAMVQMPAGFAPDPGYPPLWLRDGAEIGVAGQAGGQTVVLGFSGPNLVHRRMIAQNSGAGAAGEKILDLAASPDGGELALAIAHAADNRLELALLDLNPPDAAGPRRAIAALGGAYDFAQLTWLDQATIALAVRGARPAPEQPVAQTAAAESAIAAAGSNGGLYLIKPDGQSPPRPIEHIRCPLSHLTFSPDRHFAVADGDRGASPAIVYVRDQACRMLGLRDPIKVLGWAPNSEAFLYAGHAGEARTIGVFRYDLATSQSRPIAVSSSAAAYASDGAIIALGNRELTWRQAVAAPDVPVKAEIARFDPYQPQQEVNSLGFESPPALLAQSTIVNSTASDSGVIDTAIAAEAGPLRKLIEYSYRRRSAFLIASGAARGPVTMSWSANGKLIAIMDGDAHMSMLTVIAPP